MLTSSSLRSSSPSDRICPALGAWSRAVSASLRRVCSPGALLPPSGGAGTHSKHFLPERKASRRTYRESVRSHTSIQTISGRHGCCIVNKKFREGVEELVGRSHCSQWPKSEVRILRSIFSYKRIPPRSQLHSGHTMPPDRNYRTRQEPVSCDFCRRKKLKCDRTPSCSNCQARSITCVYQGAQTKPHVAFAPHATNEAGLRAENALIKERLQRLEQAVFGRSDGHQAGESTSENRSAPMKGFGNIDLALSNRAETDHIKVHSADSRWLETAGSLGSTSLPPLRGTPTIHSVNSLSEISRVLFSDQVNSRILLPSRVETWKLFKSYEDHLDALQHIIYVPHIQRAIDELYNAMDAGKMPQWSSAALILAITASIAGYWGPYGLCLAYFDTRF
ncbi:hypothetical protein KC325_g57 [Hortaea werneckii]|nr:hypothetical protein KC325_g57 [Hortaea werneckii]